MDYDMSRTLHNFYLCVIRLWKESHSFLTCGLSLYNYSCLFLVVAQILCVDLQEFLIMLLEAQLRLCQNCFCWWQSGLRLLSQSYSHRCVMKLRMQRLHTFGWLYSVLIIHFGFFVLLLFIFFYCL